MRTCRVVVLLFLGCTSACERRTADVAAQQRRSARVDSIFADIQRDAPGCAVGVFRDCEIVLAKGYGLANVEDARRITAQTTFDLGSGANQFTALAVLLLDQQRRLSLDDDIRDDIPELPDYGTPIRIRDLLQHTSGVRDYGALDVLVGRETTTMADWLSLLSRQQRLNEAPETRHECSHSDYELPGLVIERVTREPTGDFLEREVLRPLIARMPTRPTLSGGDTIPYAYGIRLGSYRGLPTISRGSRANGIRTEIIRFPEQHFTVAALCNSRGVAAVRRRVSLAE